MPFTIYRITEANLPNRQLRKRFSKALGIDVSLSIERRLVKTINRLAQIMVESTKSVIPIDSGELRNEHVYVNFARQSKLEAMIYIDDSGHLGSRRNRAYVASFIAAILESGSNQYGKMGRSQESDNVTDIRFGSYSSISATQSTKFVDRAIRQFERNRNRAIPLS